VEGKALAELGRLPQIMGGYDPQSAEAGAALFRSITSDTRIVSSMEAAEMIKLMDNCYRYAVFAIGNELGLACEALGLDAGEVIAAANWHYPRNDIKMPGAGVGGGCLPKDARILIDAMRTSGARPTLLVAARRVNEGMPRRMFEIVDRFHSSNGISKRLSKILILGFAFKGNPQVNDTRHSPGGCLSRLLGKAGYKVCGADPAVSNDQIRSFGAEPCEAKDGFSHATAAVAMNDNPSFKALDLARLSRLMAKPCLIVDGWRILDESTLKLGSKVTFRRLGNGKDARVC
jgi:UDP-N-acetyl-D-mannosaminuronic acid dehydrogenase